MSLHLQCLAFCNVFLPVFMPSITLYAGLPYRAACHVVLSYACPLVTSCFESPQLLSAECHVVIAYKQCLGLFTILHRLMLFGEVMLSV